MLRALKSGRFTGIFMAPTHFRQIFKLLQDVLAACRAPPIRTIISNAAPLSQAMKEQIIDYFGAGILHEVYGSTEGGIISNLRPSDQLRKQRCVGLPFPATLVKVLDETGAECPPGVAGELFSKSPFVFSHYWRNETETQDAVRGGWVTVGDIARFDEDGFLYIVDRKKDMIISGGVNIYPREIEEALATHPDVIDSAVVGVSDEHWGEAIKAFIVRRSGRVVLKDVLSRYLAGKITRYKVPRHFEFIAELPRNANGKILKTALRSHLTPAEL